MHTLEFSGQTVSLYHYIVISVPEGQRGAEPYLTSLGTGLRQRNLGDRNEMIRARKWVRKRHTLQKFVSLCSQFPSMWFSTVRSLEIAGNCPRYKGFSVWD